MAVLKQAQTNAELTTNPITTLLDYLSGSNWQATSPAASEVRFARRFADMSATYTVIIKHLATTSVEQVLGATRHRFTGRYKVHVVSRGATQQDSIDKKFAIENEIRRIIKTNVRGLQTSGFDLVQMNDDFVEIETGNESASNNGIAGDFSFSVRSVATITLTYDMTVV